MNLEITAWQYHLIQKEIIRLEEEYQDTRDQLDGWDIQKYQVEIANLKQILQNEYITIKPHY